MKTFMIILGLIVMVIGALWSIGFPIYKRCVKEESLERSCYELVLSCIACVLSFISLCVTLIA